MAAGGQGRRRDRLDHRVPRPGRLWILDRGFVIQVWLTSRIHRYLGIGFALMILPVSLGSTAVIDAAEGALWAPGLAARCSIQSLRYTVDKTTREILFLPLPADIKLKAKSFVDVTVDRVAKALGALLLVAVKPWGLHLDWQRLSYASLAVTALWIFMSLRARQRYLTAFRHSIERRDDGARRRAPDAARISRPSRRWSQELSQPDPSRVVYAIDILESLDKRNLVTPLLLYHESPAVRRRALRAIGAVRSDIARSWLPQVRRMLGDPDSGVRAAAIVAIGAINNEDAATLSRPLLADPDPRIRVTAACALAIASFATSGDAS